MQGEACPPPPLCFMCYRDWQTSASGSPRPPPRPNTVRLKIRRVYLIIRLQARIRQGAPGIPAFTRWGWSGVHGCGPRPVFLDTFLRPGLPFGQRMGLQQNADLKDYLARTIGASFPHRPIAHFTFDRPGIAPRPTGDREFIEYLPEHTFMKGRPLPRGGETRNASFSGEPLSRHA